ncbi:MAG TPA: esterase [Actinobacteria bacterium]|nr:esterase [Actinomycetota bacterium]
MAINIMAKSKQPKIGLALGSGGPKGLSHIGIIKVLEKNNIPIDFIAGVSIGSVVGGFYAYTKNIEKIEEIALSNNWRHTLSLFFDPSLSQGLINGRKIKVFIENIIDKIHFKDLKIPFSVVTTDIKTGKAVIMDKGEVATAIRASSSIPLIFKPVKLGNSLLVDGGLSIPVPAGVVRGMGADIVIAVNLDADYFSDIQDSNFGFYRIANNSIKLLRYNLSSSNIRDADIIINPKVGKVGWNKFIDSKSVILAGEEAMQLSILQLKELIKNRSSSTLGDV